MLVAGLLSASGLRHNGNCTLSFSRHPRRMAVEDVACNFDDGADFPVVVL
jgi:hypothetical protein